MKKKLQSVARRQEALTRNRIVEEAIVLLDSGGEAGLTFRALSERLATGPGAIYWHVANKRELLTAACDEIVAHAMNAPVADATPNAAIRAVALAMFDAIDVHPWVGAALTRAPGSLPMVRILERIGQQLFALGVPGSSQWASVSVLLSYILGVGGQNAANTKLALELGLDRLHFLDDVASAWTQLDAASYPFTRGVAAHIRAHDDRADFLAGIDLILAGMAARDHASKR